AASSFATRRSSDLQGLPLNEQPDQFDDGENELEQVAFHRIRVGLQPLREDARQSRCAHTQPPSCAARTELSNARNSSRTRSTPANEIVTSPASTTPVPSSRASRSTKAICPGGTAGANAWVMAHPPRRRSRPATALRTRYATVRSARAATPRPHRTRACPQRRPGTPR